MLQDPWGEGDWKIIRAEVQGVCYGMLETTSKKSHQHGYLQKSWKKTIDMLMWVGKAQEASTLNKEKQAPQRGIIKGRGFLGMLEWEKK